MAARFNSELSSGSYNVKQNHPQICPTFLLNLTCRRSLYDVTLEPSRTSVEFKDWGPVLAFIEGAITKVWSESLPSVPVKHETRKKRCRNQKSEALFDHPASLKKLAQCCSDLSAWSDCLSTPERASQDAAEMGKRQNWDEFFCQAECSIQSHDAAVTNLEGSMSLEIDNYLERSRTLICAKDNFSENELFATERPNKQGKCNATSGWEGIALKSEVQMRDLSARSSPFADSVDFSDITDVNQNSTRPFLRSCFSRRSMLLDDSSSENDEGFESSENFRMKEKSDGLHHREPMPLFEGAPLVHDMAPYVLSPLRCETLQFKKRNQVAFLEDQVNSISSASGDLHEENYLSNSLNPKQEPFDSDCSPMISDPFLGIRFGDERFIKEDEDISPFELDDARHECWVDKPVDGCNFVHDRISGSGGETCLFSKSFTLKSAAVKRGNTTVYQDFYLTNNNVSSCSARYNDEAGWLRPQSSCKETLNTFSVPISRNFPFNDGDDDSHGCTHIWSPRKQSDCRKREPRSRSAPPFHRGKKKFFALNANSVKEHAKPKSPIIHHAPILPETSINHFQHCSSSNSLNRSPNSCSQCCFSFVRNPGDEISNTRTLRDINVVQNSKLHGHPINSCSLDSAEGPRSSTAEDLLDPALKWRQTFPVTAGGSLSLESRTEDNILDISSVILHASGDSLMPNSIDKRFLETAKVLQQVDKKFIPIVAGRTLAVIDQHAADERIRLEELREKVLSGESRTVTYLDIGQELVLPEIGYQLLYSYAEQVQSWGWIYDIHARNSESFKKNLKVLHKQPTVTRLLAVPCILDVNLTNIDLLEYLQQLSDTDGSSTVPPAVHRVLNNKACRGAIMFGDSLLPSECSLIVEELKQTSLCFQCAHGRPTTVPLVNLDVLHKQIASKLGPGRNGSCESWHGFSRHEISLERAKRRLG